MVFSSDKQTLFPKRWYWKAVLHEIYHSEHTWGVIKWNNFPINMFYYILWSKKRPFHNTWLRISIQQNIAVHQRVHTSSCIVERTTLLIMFYCCFICQYHSGYHILCWHFSLLSKYLNLSLHQVIEFKKPTWTPNHIRRFLRRDGNNKIFQHSLLLVWRFMEGIMWVGGSSIIVLQQLTLL